MHKPLTADQREALMSPVKPLTLTKQQKLIRWAEAIRQYKRRIRMLHELEYMTSGDLATIRLADSIFDVASKDPMLAAAGLKSNDALAGKEFFELACDELHFIGCDCLGTIDNAQMAERVDRLARATRRRPF